MGKIAEVHARQLWALGVLADASQYDISKRINAIPVQDHPEFSKKYEDQPLDQLKADLKVLESQKQIQVGYEHLHPAHSELFLTSKGLETVRKHRRTPEEAIREDNPGQYAANQIAKRAKTISWCALGVSIASLIVAAFAVFYHPSTNSSGGHFDPHSGTTPATLPTTR